MRRLLLALTLLLVTPRLTAQCVPQPVTCNVNECELGDVSLSVTAGGSNEFCAGEVVTVAVDENQSINFDQYIYYWCDGAVDTVLQNEQPATHIYTVAPDEICDVSEDGFFVRVIGQKFCEDGKVTCRTAGVSLTIRYPPLATFTVPSSTVCISDGFSPGNTSCNADNFVWAFGDGTTSDEENPEHEYDQPGVYPVTLTVMNACGVDSVTQIIAVVEAPDSDFSLSDSVGCVNDVFEFGAQVNSFTAAFWNITPNDTAAWCYTDTSMNAASSDISVRFKQPGSYTLLLTGTNACGSEEKELEVTILEVPQYGLFPPQPNCGPLTLTAEDLGFFLTGDPTTINWTFTGADRETAEGEDFGEVTFTQSGLITLTVASACDPDPPTFSVPVVIVPDQPVTIAPVEEICATTDTLQLTATPTGGNWTGNGITPDGRYVPDAAGSYDFTYRLPNAPCNNEATVTLVVNDAPLVNLNDGTAACDQATLTAADLGFSVNGAYTSLTWTFENGSPGTATGEDPGTIEFSESGSVILDVTSQCGNFQFTADVLIAQTQVVTLQPQPVLCAGSDAVQLEASPTNGSWSGTAVTPDGLFDPGAAGPGTFQLTFTLDNTPCDNLETLTVTVVESQTVTVIDRTICVDGSPISLAANPGGGNWSGTGITDAGAGTFDPALAGVGEAFPTYTYDDTNGCRITARPRVLVEALPVLSGPDTLALCRTAETLLLPDLLDIQVDSTGGLLTWSGPGTNEVGEFNADAANLGTGFYTIVYQYARNECTVADSLTIDLTDPAPLTVSAPPEACINDGSLQLESNLTGGEWFGPGVDAATGLVDLEAAGGGTYVYTYVTAAGTSCEQTENLTLTVLDPAGGLTAGGPVEVCAGPADFTLEGASPGGGTWSGTGITDGPAGIVDLNQLTAGETYTYTYCLSTPSLGDCAACRDRTLTLNPKPDAGFAAPDTVCTNESFSLAPTQTGLSYQWDLGDGSNSMEEELTYIYPMVGTYLVELVVETAAGCRDTTSRAVYVSESPAPGFELPVDDACAPFTLQLNDQSAGDNVTVRYLIGGDTLLTPTYVFDSITDDTYFLIEQLASNACGERRAIDSVLVRPYPFARFGLESDEGCSPYTSAVSNVTLGNPDNFFWDLGLPGVTSTADVPELPIYTTPDDSVSVYVITLIASNECGVDTFTRNISIFPPDVNAFIQLDTLSGCPPLTVPIESFSTAGSELSWTIIGPGGNQTGGGSGVRPDITLTDIGIHTIILTATGCGTDSDTVTVEVLPAPTVNFTAPTTTCRDAPITFINNSPGIAGSEWDFGDGTTSTAYSPVHAYAAAGTYTITYRGTAAGTSCPGVISKEITVLDAPTSAAGPPLASGCPGLTVNFVNNSTGFGTLNYVWNFGDGSNGSTLAEPTHTFSLAGDFTVRLITRDQAGCFSDTAFTQVNVFPDPVSSFTLSSSTVCLGDAPLTITNTTPQTAGVDWLVAGEAFFGPTITYQPTAVGDYTVRQAVENTFGCRDTSLQSFSVAQGPVAAAGSDANDVCVGEPINFTNSSQFATTNRWEFGDGTGSSQSEPSHTFEAAGNYEILLIVTAATGCAPDTARVNVTVRPQPNAFFSVNRTDDCGAPVPVTFTNESTDNLSNQWTFGDGGSSTALSPTHVYEMEGIYPVQLIVTSASGCADTVRSEIDVFGDPTAGVDLAAADLCAGEVLTLSADETQAVGYEWYVAPSRQPRVGRVQQFVFDTAGVYEISLIAIYNNRCRDTLDNTVTVTVYGQPTADFSAVVDQSPTIIGDVEFTNLSSPEADEFFWDLGDGTTGTSGGNFTHEYDINRSIEVTLIATANNGGLFTCADTITKPIAPEWIGSFEVPNVISPNYGDRAIRIWGAVGSGVEDYELRVYSPFGNLIWLTSELSSGQPSGRWDGTRQGVAVPQGAYSWDARVTFADGREVRKRGSVTVLR